LALRRGSTRGRVTGSLRRNKGWEEGPGGTAITTITTSSSVFLGQAVQPTQDGLTLLRTRGLLSAYLTAGGAGEGFQGAYGIGKATAAAVTAGIASVPTPITEQQWDGWLYWTPISVHQQSAFQATGHTFQLADQLDSKAMRKIAQEEAFYMAIEVVEIGTASMDVFFDSRMLFALP